MADASAEAPRSRPLAGPARFFWPGGLSARLLVLTVVFVALGGALAMPPALAAYEEQWLLDRVRAAELASLAADVAPDRVVSEQLESQLLAGPASRSWPIQTDGVRRLVLAGAGARGALCGRPARAAAGLAGSPRRSRPCWAGTGGVRVVAEPRFRKADFIEFVAPDAELKRALASYLWQAAVRHRLRGHRRRGFRVVLATSGTARTAVGIESAGGLIVHWSAETSREKGRV